MPDEYCVSKYGSKFIFNLYERYVTADEKSIKNRHKYRISLSTIKANELFLLQLFMMIKNKRKRRQHNLSELALAPYDVESSNNSSTVIPLPSTDYPSNSSDSPTSHSAESPTKLIKVKPLEESPESEESAEEQVEEIEESMRENEQKKQTIETAHESSQTFSFMKVKKVENVKNQTVKTEHFVYNSEDDEEEVENSDDESEEDQEEYEEEEEQMRQEQKQKEKKQKVNGVTKEKVFKAQNFSHLISSPVPPTCTLQCLIICNEDFFSTTRSYDLFLVKDKKKILTAVKSRVQIKSSFEILDPQKKVIGKVKSNFTGTQFIVVSENQKEISYIEYNPNIFGFAGQRDITVVRNSNKKLDEVSHFSKIKTFYENGFSSKFEKFSSKKPKKKKGDGYEVDFHGKVSIPSMRNFILEDEKADQCLLFGKKQEGAYILEIGNPFSIIEAFGVAVTALDRKILVR